MKKTILILTLFFICNSSFAGEFQIPLDFLNNIAKVSEFKTSKNFIQNLLVKQVIKNTTINDVKLKDYSTEEITKYFNEDEFFLKSGSNVLVEPITGATLEFNSDGVCKNNDCTITVDLNGSKGPNKLWVKDDEPQDRIQFIIKRSENNELTVITPDFIN